MFYFCYVDGSKGHRILLVRCYGHCISLLLQKEKTQGLNNDVFCDMDGCCELDKKIGLIGCTLGMRMKILLRLQ